MAGTVGVEDRRCEVPGCKKPARSRFCERHWKQVLRAGVPAEIAYARMMAAVFRLGLIETGEDQDTEFDATLLEFFDAFLDCSRHYRTVMSKLMRRIPPQ